jgi:glycosyltransferase involved in cell wall biosynthesis
VIVTSAYLERQIAPLLREGAVTRIPNAPERLDVASKHMRGVAELPGINILIVGMLTENKGQLQFVRHLERLIRRVPSAVVHLAGRGARVAEKIRSTVAKKGLADRVVLHGYVGRERLYQLYRECQIVAAPVMWPEPFGRVPLEAALARRPVVAFALGGLVESIVDGETGRLVEPGNFEAMLDTIRTLAEDPALRYRYGAAAFKHVVSLYDVSELKQRLTQAWAELSDTSAPAPRATG